MQIFGIRKKFDISATSEKVGDLCYIVPKMAVAFTYFLSHTCFNLNHISLNGLEYLLI